VSETTNWLCKNKHVLGQVSRNGRGIRQLALYRHAIDMEAPEPGEIEVIATVEGLVIDVKCSECGAVRTWVPGEESLRRLLKARAAMWEGSKNAP